MPVAARVRCPTPDIGKKIGGRNHVDIGEAGHLCLEHRVRPGDEGSRSAFGTRIRLAGEGEAGQLGGPPGNLYVVVAVEPHPIFVRDGLDVHLEMPINFAQAALGATVNIPTLDGEEQSLDIPAGTQTGKTFVKKGLGVPRLQRSGRGDMIVTTRVVTPVNLDAEQKELLRKLAKTLGDMPVEPQKGFFDRIFGSD